LFFKNCCKHSSIYFLFFIHHAISIAHAA
jgi:hypothetical protein